MDKTEIVKKAVKTALKKVEEFAMKIATVAFPRLVEQIKGLVGLVKKILQMAVSLLPNLPKHVKLFPGHVVTMLGVVAVADMVFNTTKYVVLAFYLKRAAAGHPELANSMAEVDTNLDNIASCLEEANQGFDDLVSETLSLCDPEGPTDDDVDQLKNLRDGIAEPGKGLYQCFGELRKSKGLLESIILSLGKGAAKQKIVAVFRFFGKVREFRKKAEDGGEDKAIKKAPAEKSRQSSRPKVNRPVSTAAADDLESPWVLAPAGRAQLTPETGVNPQWSPIENHSRPLSATMELQTWSEPFRQVSANQQQLGIGPDHYLPPPSSSKDLTRNSPYLGDPHGNVQNLGHKLYRPVNYREVEPLQWNRPMSTQQITNETHTPYQRAPNYQRADHLNNQRYYPFFDQRNAQLNNQVNAQFNERRGTSFNDLDRDRRVMPIIDQRVQPLSNQKVHYANDRRVNPQGYKSLPTMIEPTKKLEVPLSFQAKMLPLPLTCPPEPPIDYQ